MEGLDVDGVMDERLWSIGTAVMSDAKGNDKPTINKFRIYM